MSVQDFEHESFLNLTTFRKNGQGVVTPMWFILRDGKIYMRTGATSAKLRRIANNPQVRVQPCDARGKKVHGSPLDGTAGALPATDIEWIEQMLNAKYGIMKKLLNVVHAITRVEVAVFEISVP